MTGLLTERDLALVRHRLAIGASRIDLCDLPDAGPAVVKRQRPPRGPWRAWGMALLARATGLEVLRPVPNYGGTCGEVTELGRLAALARAGVRVPEVLHAQPGFFVMRRLEGPNLADRVAERGEAGFAAWQRGLDAIAALHARGLCLSQAFARNLIETPDGIAFIDFEDDPLETLALDVAQARDWMAYLHSTAWLLDVGPARTRAMLASTLARSTGSVRTCVGGAGRSLTVFRWLPPRRRPWGREALGLGALARLLA